MHPTAPHLEVRSLSFGYPEYPGFHPGEVLQDASFTVESGSMELLLGAPDTGKSTLGRIVAGLVPRFSGGALTGSLWLERRPLSCPPYARLAELGLVFQSAHEQLITGRCDTEVAFALESLGLPESAMRRRVADALAEQGLSGMEERNPQSLSGGEKKRLLLACLRAVDPPLWVLDETLEELDARFRRELLQRLRDRGRTVLVLSAKWQPDLADFCTAVHFLRGGRVRSLRPLPPEAELQGELRREGLLLPKRPAGQDAQGPALLRAEGLRFAYPESGFRLEVPFLELRRGEVLALVGDNGCGKSTLARLLCGLLRPRGGRVLLAEEDGTLKTASPQRLNRAVAYLFQNPDLQIFLPTVAEELGYGPRLAGWPEAQIRARVQESAELFGLPALETPPSLMSYGARKRLQAATYHLLSRGVVIFDEGDSGLGQVEFARVVERFRSPERSLVVITHDGELASFLAHRTVRLAGGRMR